MTGDRDDRKMRREQYSGMYHFVCSCGQGMATNGDLLSNAITSGKYYRCPNHLYGKCNKSYSAEQFKEQAHWSKPNIPANL